MALTLPVRQGTDEWLEARRGLVTATDIPVLLGLSPYRCEADLADEKLHGIRQETSVRMRIGSALQPLIGELYEEATGLTLVHVEDMWRHETIDWAAASPDAHVFAQPRLVEFKQTTSTSRFADGVPQDIEAQVAWQLGVTGYPVADIAVLTRDDLAVYEQPADEALFADLVRIAEDFRRRLEAGGPFSRDLNRIKRDHPSDDGTEIEADAEVSEAVRALIDARRTRKAIEEREEALEAAIKARMGDHAVMRGEGFHITWKRTKDRTETDWKSLSTGLLKTLPETERDALVGLHSGVREGFRPFRLVVEGDKE